MKRTLLFIMCVLASITMQAQEKSNDYLPFVEEGKKWQVVRSDFEQGYHIDQYMFLNGEKLTVDDETGKVWFVMYRNDERLTVGNEKWLLLREKDRKVYFMTPGPEDYYMPEEYLMFDFSLKAGDTYETYSFDDQKVVSYKVLSVGDYTEGPEIIRQDDDQVADNMRTQRRYLRKWIVCRTDDESRQKTWIEGVGSLEGPLANLYDSRPVSSMDYQAYIEYNNRDYLYLPFSFHDELCQIHGCNLPKGAEDQLEDWYHDLTYELEGDCLHVFGKAVLNCGSYNYAYFIERPTDDPSVHKLSLQIQEVGPSANCYSLFATDFYVSGFDPNINYIVVDNMGEKHPVINKTQQMAYRPFVEDGKVWKLGNTDSYPVQQVSYYYFDGDTIIDGKTCKQMMCREYVSPKYPNYDYLSQQPSLYYVGAWYEEDKKVYEYDTTDKQFRLMYDFSLEANGIFEINYPPYVFLYRIGPRQTGGIEGFKGVYRDVWEWEDGKIYKCAPWLEGVGIVYGSPTTNVLNVELADPRWFLISCTVGEEVIYLIDGVEDEATPEGARKRRFDFTHTIKIQPKSRTRSEAEQPLYGEYNDQRLGINLDPLDDTYQVRITDETGKAVYEKSINAGNIVGLNIDISAYAEGPYIVTVENSYESFRGEFEAQTTGIEEVHRETITDNRYYNLQGQRLSSLRKGLNIVNGQKVFVK